MIKASVFANKKSSSNGAIANSTNSLSTSSSFFENSLQQNHPSSTNRNWQQTPTNSRRLIGLIQQQAGGLLYPTNSINNVRPALAAFNQHGINSNSAVTNVKANVKPNTLPGLVEQLNEVRKSDKDLLFGHEICSCRFLVAR